ncbi:hypothetical protein V2A60_010287 [Cordyceps javanica]
MSSRGFAFNPDRRWAFETDPDRVPRRVICITRHWPPGWALEAQYIAQWDNPTDAGVTFSEAETTLHPSDYGSHAVVVGELVPEAAQAQCMKVAFPSPEQRSLPDHESTGLRGQLEWVTLDKKRPRCVVVRMIDASPANFYVLAKSTENGLCHWVSSPGETRRRLFIAFYNEWYEESTCKAPHLVRNAVRENLEKFCVKYMQELRNLPKDTIGSRLTGPQPSHEANRARPEPMPSAESGHTRTPAPIESTQSNDGPQVHKDLPRESTSSQTIHLRESLAHLFKVDVGYTHDDAVKLLSHLNFYDLRHFETSHYTSLILDLAILLRNKALKVQSVPTRLRACMVGEWFRRFDRCGAEVWETERVMGSLATELRDV